MQWQGANGDKVRHSRFGLDGDASCGFLVCFGLWLSFVGFLLECRNCFENAENLVRVSSGGI